MDRKSSNTESQKTKIKFFDTSVITTGMLFTENYTVKKEWTAEAMGSGEVPVLSTPALILACETTAYRALKHLLDDEFTSVGTKVEVLHTSPCNVNENFRVEAMITQVHRSFITFTITVTSGDRIIATGLHRRHIVNKDSFLQKAAKDGTRNLR